MRTDLQWKYAAMNNKLLLLFPFLWLSVTFYGAELRRGTGPSGDAPAPSFLCPQQCMLIRASACIGVILHHLTQQVTGYGSVSVGPVTIFNYLGILFTALFFFFSGYGLLTSLYEKPGYLRSFLPRRLPAVLIPFWTVNLLGICLNAFFYGVHYTPSRILSDLSGLTLINSNGWFIVEIVILYLLFWLLFSLVKNRDTALVLLCLATCLLIVYASLQGHDVSGSKAHWFKGEWWYNSTVTFLFGLLYARFRKNIDAFFMRHYIFKLAVTALFFAFTLYLSVYAVRHLGYYYISPYLQYSERKARWITLAAQMAVCLVFTLLVLLLNMRITLGNRVLRHLSRITTELFLIHGYFVSRIFSSVRMPAPLRFGAVLCCSIACACVVSPFVRLTVRYVTAFLSARLAALPEFPLPAFPLSSSRIFRGKVHTTDTLEYEAALREKEKHKKKLRIAAAAGACLAVSAVLYLLADRFVITRLEYEKEKTALLGAEVGDEVLWGRYETDPKRPGKERLTWIVVRREADRVCLLCRSGIAGSSYHHKHEEIDWESSDLRSWLNSKQFTSIFSRYEAPAVIPENGDRITLPDVADAMEFFSNDNERELAITPAAQLSGTNINTLSKHHEWDLKGYRSSWWWLRGDAGQKKVTAPIVTVDGTIELSEKAVNKPNGAVRPMIWIRLEKKNGDTE